LGAEALAGPAADAEKRIPLRSRGWAVPFAGYPVGAAVGPGRLEGIGVSDMHEPAAEAILVTEPSQLKAFAHPTRVRELELLIDSPMTTKQLGDALGMSPAQAHYHLKFLERAGLVRLVFRNEKAGVVEKYYRATSRKYIVTQTVGTFGEPGAVILESLAGAMLQGAVAMAGAMAAGAPGAAGGGGGCSGAREVAVGSDGGGGLGLVYGATERVAVPRERLEDLLVVASMLQTAQEGLQVLGDQTRSGGGERSPADAEEFELTFGLYAAPRDQERKAGRGPAGA